MNEMIIEILHGACVVERTVGSIVGLIAQKFMKNKIKTKRSETKLYMEFEKAHVLAECWDRQSGRFLKIFASRLERCVPKENSPGSKVGSPQTHDDSWNSHVGCPDDMESCLNEAPSSL